MPACLPAAQPANLVSSRPLRRLLFHERCHTLQNLHALFLSISSNDFCIIMACPKASMTRGPSALLA